MTGKTLGRDYTVQTVQSIYQDQGYSQPRMSADTSTRTRILKAASRVAQAVGSSKLTIDAVAKEAEVSKGGVLYHFPTKHELLAGLLQFSVVQLKTRVQHHKGNPSTKFPHIEALIKASQSTAPAERTLPLSVLTAAAEDKELLAPVQEFSSQWYQDISREGDLPLLMLLAIEGLQFLEMLNLVEISKEERWNLFQKMLDALELRS